MPFIEVQTNPIKNQKQQSFTLAPRPLNFKPVPTNVTPGPANTFSSIASIHQAIITPGLIQINLIFLADLLQ